MNFLKRLASRLPTRWQNHLRSARSRALIRRGEFDAGEPEFDRLTEWLQPGDWALDIGANMGSYTVAMSRLVGETGRIIALEPVPTTFAILVSNLQSAKCDNVTMINGAASDRTDVCQMHIPRFDTGLENFYQARLTKGGDVTQIRRLNVLTLALDALGLPNRVALAKVDVEGHEEAVVAGMWKLIHRDRPVLIIETSSQAIQERLATLGYRMEHMSGSPNRVFVSHERAPA